MNFLKIKLKLKFYFIPFKLLKKIQMSKKYFFLDHKFQYNTFY